MEELADIDRLLQDEGTNKNQNRISKDKVTSLDDKTHQGIDGGYEDPKGGLPKFVINEAKYGLSKGKRSYARNDIEPG